MKDIHFTVKQQKKEIGYILVSFLIAIGVNIYAIIIYGTEWKELYTQWFMVLVLTAVFYFLILLVRLLCWGVIKIVTQKNVEKPEGNH